MRAVCPETGVEVESKKAKAEQKLWRHFAFGLMFDSELSEKTQDLTRVPKSG